MATTLRNLDDLYADLSNLEMACVLDGGSARVQIMLPGQDEWLDAWVDLDGLCLDEPSNFGYVRSLKGVRVSRHY